MGVLVAADDSCFSVHQKHRNRASDHSRSPHDHTALAFELYPGGINELEGRQSGTRGPHGSPVDHIADISGVHAFDIFVGADEFLDVVGIDTIGQRHM